MKIAIIGCGVSGMSAGITLQKAGIDTVIYEKSNNPGGVIAVYTKDILINNALEFVFGTAQGTFSNDMWKSLGMFKKPPEHKDCFNTFFWDGHSVGIYKDFDKTVNELVSISPRDKKRIQKIGNSVRRFKKIEIPLITKASDNVFLRLSRLFLNCFAVVPDVLCYGFVRCDKFSKKIKSQALRSFFSDVLTGERSVLQYIVLWSFYSSGNFSTPDNNQQEMIQTLYNTYIDCGGKVNFNSALFDVAVSNKKISSLNFADKSENDFDYVIFSNDILSVNTIMNNSDISFPILDKTLKKEHVTSSCMLYFKVNGENTEEIFDKASIPCRSFKVGSRYINNFSVRSQKSAGTDKQVISVTLYQNEKDFAEWKRISDSDPDEIKKEKHRIAQSVAAAVEDYFPDLHEKLELCDITTPLTYYCYAGVNCGGWMPESWNPLLYLCFGRGSMPGIKNASIIGQKVFPIGGTTIGAFSAVKAAERLIRQKNK